MSLFTETVYLVRRAAETGRDSLNNPIYGEPSRTSAPGWVDISANGEILDRRETLTENITLYLDGIVDLEGVDEVEYRGEVFQINGDPAKQASGFVVGAYTVAPLRRVEG